MTGSFCARHCTIFRYEPHPNYGWSQTSTLSKRAKGWDHTARGKVINQITGINTSTMPSRGHLLSLHPNHHVRSAGSPAGCAGRRGYRLLSSFACRLTEQPLPRRESHLLPLCGSAGPRPRGRALRCFHGSLLKIMDYLLSDGKDHRRTFA